MSELARHLDISRQAVSKAVKAGRLARGADGKIDLAVAERVFERRVNGHADNLAFASPEAEMAHWRGVLAALKRRTPLHGYEPGEYARIEYVYAALESRNERFGYEIQTRLPRHAELITAAAREGGEALVRRYLEALASRLVEHLNRAKDDMCDELSADGRIGDG